MAKPTHEYCLAKIAELERLIEVSSEEARADYRAVLESWRWLAERAREREALAGDGRSE